MEGWPRTKDVDPSVKQFYTFRDSLTTVQGVVFFENRLYIPKVERDRVLKEIHDGHQGETKCIRRAVDVVWWPGMTADIRSLVKGCSKCEEFRLKLREPLICSSWPERPWWLLAVDLCTKDGQTYLVVVDYCSRYITANELSDLSDTKTIVSKLKTLFCLLGIPNTMKMDHNFCLIGFSLSCQNGMLNT